MSAKILTKADKKEIVAIVQQKTMTERWRAIKEKETALYNEILDKYIPKQFVDQTAGMPKDWFATISKVEIRYLNTKKRWYQEKTITGETRKAPDSMVGHYNEFEVAAYKVDRNDDSRPGLSADLIEKFNAILAMEEAIDADLEDLAIKTMSVLNMARTRKKLVEIWPEVVNYWNPEEHEPAKNPPAIITPDGLNCCIKQMAEAA